MKETIDSVNLTEKIDYYFTYDEIVEKVETKEPPELIGEFSKDSVKLGYSTLIFGIVNDMDVINRKVLGNLTGLDLMEKEKLYDYLTITLSLNTTDVVEWSIAMLVSKDSDFIPDLIAQAFKSDLKG